MSNIEDTVRRVLDLAAAYRLAEHPQASLTELEAAIRTALSAGGGEAVAWQYRTIDEDVWWNTSKEGAESRAKFPKLYEVRALGVIGGAGGVAAKPPFGICDGKEQEAWEAHGKAEGLDMEQHPMFYLFLNPQTNAARQAWKGAIRHCLNALDAAPPLPGVVAGGEPE